MANKKTSTTEKFVSETPAFVKRVLLSKVKDQQDFKRNTRSTGSVYTVQQKKKGIVTYTSKTSGKTYNLTGSTTFVFVQK